MERYPLLFGRKDVVAGQGFVASVEVKGRALLVSEDGGYWMYGVNPGGIAAGDLVREVAMVKFSIAYQSVIIDIAYEAKDFAQFRQMVDSFFGETSDADEWESAVQDVRSGKVSAEWVRKGKAGSELGVEIVDLTDSPEQRVPDRNSSLCHDPRVPSDFAQAA